MTTRRAIRPQLADLEPPRCMTWVYADESRSARPLTRLIATSEVIADVSTPRRCMTRTSIAVLPRPVGVTSLANMLLSCRDVIGPSGSGGPSPARTPTADAGKVSMLHRRAMSTLDRSARPRAAPMSRNEPIWSSRPFDRQEGVDDGDGPTERRATSLALGG